MLTPGSTLTYFKQLVKPGEGDAEPSSITAALYVNGVLNAASVTITGTLGAKTFTVTVPVGCVRGDRLSIKAAVVWDAGGPTFTEEVYTDHVDTSTSMIGTDGRVLISTDVQDLSGSLTVALNAAGRSAIATAVWAIATSALTAAGSIGKFFMDNWTAARAALLDYLSATGVVSVNSRLSGTRLRLTRCVTNTIPITGLGSLSAYTKIWFTVKGVKETDADSASQLQVEKTGGCLYLRGATGTASDATLTVTDAVLGNISIKLKPAAAAKLQAMAAVAWDVKGSDGTDAVTLIEGTGYIEDPVTQRLT